MPIPTPFHSRTKALCHSYAWKEWAGHYAVCAFDTCHDPEYYAFRHTAGLLDVSPLFKYEFRGPDAADLLAYLSTRNIKKLGANRVTYTCFCDPYGKVVDDGTVTRLSEAHYRVTTASPSLCWFEEHARGFDATIEDVSESLGALALQGPTSRDILSAVAGSSVERLRFFRFLRSAIDGVEVDITRTGYTGDLGYEIWIPAQSAERVWDRLMEGGATYGLRPAGLDALDVTRVEAGFVLQGVDYFSSLLCEIESRKSTPYELGLGWTVSLDRDPFIGQEALRQEKERGPAWAFIGLDIDWEELEALYERYALPPHLPATAWRTPVPVFDRGRRQIGQATSGTWSPILKKNIALATVEASHASVGTELRIEHTVEYRRETVTATVAATPFFNPERKRS